MLALGDSAFDGFLTLGFGSVSASGVGDVDLIIFLFLSDPVSDALFSSTQFSLIASTEFYILALSLTTFDAPCFNSFEVELTLFLAEFGAG